jgi:phosphohistidine phosphatase SixA
LLALAAWLARPPARGAELAAEPSPPRVVLVLRHAEKALPAAGTDPASPQASDPPLSEAGRERAVALAELLAPARPAALFASQYQRAQATLAPLSEACGTGVTVVPAAETAALVQALDALPPGSLAIVAGHSNTVPAIVRALGGAVAGLPAGESLGEADYGRLFAVVRCADGSASTFELAIPARPAR